MLASPQRRDSRSCGRSGIVHEYVCVIIHGEYVEPFSSVLDMTDSYSLLGSAVFLRLLPHAFNRAPHDLGLLPESRESILPHDPLWLPGTVRAYDGPRSALHRENGATPHRTVVSTTGLEGVLCLP